VLKTPQAAGDANVLKRFFRDYFVIVVDRKNSIYGISDYFYMSLYAKFQIKWWLHDHFSVPFRCLYLPNAWSQTLHKAHTFRVSAFHQKHWFEVRLFPVGCAQDSRRVTSKREKMLFFGSGSVLAIKFRNFYDSTPRHL